MSKRCSNKAEEDDFLGKKESEFYVEEILEHKYEFDIYQFKVKWLDYNEEIETKEGQRMFSNQQAAL